MCTFAYTYAPLHINTHTPIYLHTHAHRWHVTLFLGRPEYVSSIQGRNSQQRKARIPPKSNLVNQCTLLGLCRRVWVRGWLWRQKWLTVSPKSHPQPEWQFTNSRCLEFTAQSAGSSTGWKVSSKWLSLSEHLLGRSSDLCLLYTAQLAWLFFSCSLTGLSLF